MSKTAIVPSEAHWEMAVEGCKMLPALHNPEEHPLSVVVRVFAAATSARPPVPDELIEEAAKAIYAYFCKNVLTLFTQAPWDEISESSREHYRNMARAAARVFNGGKDE